MFLKKRIWSCKGYVVEDPGIVRIGEFGEDVSKINGIYL